MVAHANGVASSWICAAIAAAIDFISQTTFFISSGQVISPKDLPKRNL